MAKTIDLNNLFPEADDGSRSALPKQSEFMRKVLDPKGAQFVAYYGGYGSGKSVVLCSTMISQAVMYGGEYLIARNFNPELLRTTYKSFKDLLPKELLLDERIAKQEIDIRSANGGVATFYFLGLDDPGKLDSMNLSGFAFDEASQIPEEAFIKLQGRLRNKKGLRKGLLVGNPKGHDWVYRKFVSKVDIRPQDHKKFEMIVAPSTENKHLPTDYVDNMLATYSKERIQRDVMGSFDSFEGMVYSDFNRHIHLVKPFKVPESWPKFIGADHGYNNPAAWIYCALSPDNEIYVYKEYYAREKLIGDICKENLILIGKDKIEGIWIDPSVRRTNGQTGTSDWDTYLEYLPPKLGLFTATNDVELGIDRVKTYLRINETTAKPKLYIFEDCHNLVEEMSEYRYQELSPQAQGKSNDKESPRKYKDHALDAFRYAVMSRPENPREESYEDRVKKLPGTSGQLQQELYRLKRGYSKDPLDSL
jgi:phage terminase large subunit